jgi:hypothetical protein
VSAAGKKVALSALLGGLERPASAGQGATQPGPGRPGFRRPGSGRARVLLPAWLGDRKWQFALLAVAAIALLALLFSGRPEPKRQPEVVLRLPPPAATAPASPVERPADHANGRGAGGVDVALKPPVAAGEPVAAHKDVALPQPPAASTPPVTTTPPATTPAATVAGTTPPATAGEGSPGAAGDAAGGRETVRPASVGEAAGAPQPASAADVEAVRPIRAPGIVLVTRGSNLRSAAGVEAAIVGFVRAGERLEVLDGTPVRGYYRVAHGARKGWIWGPNIETAEPAPSPAN